MGWQRARTDVQIEERTANILAAAARMFATIPYDEVTITLVAREAGFTRSNVYRYFPTRESIFLAIHRADLAAWADDAAVAFERLKSPIPSESDDPLDGFIGLWTDVLVRQKRLLELAPLLSLSLERTASESEYRDFKRFTVSLVSRAIPLLAPHLPWLTDEGMTAFFLTHTALVAGAYPMSAYTPMQERVLESNDLTAMKIDFRLLYRHAIGAYLRGTRIAAGLSSRGA